MRNERVGDDDGTETVERGERETEEDEVTPVVASETGMGRAGDLCAEGGIGGRGLVLALVLGNFFFTSAGEGT